jgi:hypothetical protein
MAEPKRMERRAEEETRVQAPPRQALAVVPQRTELDRAVSDADRSVRDLSRSASMMGDIMQQYARLVSESNTATFRELESGHPRPDTFIRTPQDARRHTLASITGRSVRPAAVPQARQDAAERTAREVRGWLGDGFLGPALNSRMQAFPPVLTVENPSVYDELDLSVRRSMDDLLTSDGRYFTGTNHILARDKPERTELQAQELLLHEQLHYASWLGGGETVRWRDGEGKPVIQGPVSWLQEGLTSLFTYQIMDSHGHNPGYVSYPYETAVSFYMGKLAGQDVLRRAYLSGDFTEVRQAIDRRLGQGSFDRLLDSGSGVQALTFITSKMSAAGVNWTAWEREPAIAACFRGIAARE